MRTCNRCEEPIYDDNRLMCDQCAKDIEDGIVFIDCLICCAENDINNSVCIYCKAILTPRSK